MPRASRSRRSATGPRRFAARRRRTARRWFEASRVTGFSNSEEAAVKLTDVVPFLVEDMLKENGGKFSKAGDWQPYAVSDGNLVTGQNPASSEAAAKAFVEQLAAAGTAGSRHR